MIIICIILEKSGLFRETLRSLIASHDLGFVSNQYKKQNYYSAYKTLKKYEYYLTDYSQGTLKYYLGLLHYHGLATKQDKQKGELFFLQAGELGNEEAVKYFNSQSDTSKKH